MRALERFAPLTGALFVALAVATFIVVGDNAPDVDDPLPDVVRYWSDNDGEEMAGAIMGAYASVLLLWFAGVTRSALRLVEGETGRLSATAFGGLVIAAGGVLVNSAIEFAAADSAGEVSPQTTQALSVLYSDFFFPIIAGFAVFLLAAGLVMVRAGALTSWPGWIAIFLGVVSLSPIGFFGVLGALAWVLAFSIMLFMRGAPAMPGPRPAEPGPPPG